MEKYYFVVAIVAVIVLFFGFRFYLKHKKAPTVKYEKSGVDMAKLVQALGGKENIKNIEASMSKVTVEFDEKKLLDIDTIKSLGASGIVQNQSKLSIIFGKVSETVALELKDYIH